MSETRATIAGMALNTCGICGKPWTKIRWQVCGCTSAKDHQHWVSECDRCRVTAYEPPCSDPSLHVAVAWGRRAS